MRTRLTASLLALGIAAVLAAVQVIAQSNAANKAAQETEDKAASAASKTGNAGAANKTGDTAKGAVTAGKHAAQNKNVRIVKGPVVEWVSDDDATLAWSTNVRASAVVRYGTDPNHLSHQAESHYGGPTHRVKLSNLKPSTKYYYMLDSGQGSGTGTEAKSQVYEFETVAKGAKGKRYSFVKPKE